jgi:hypothetical protein
MNASRKWKQVNLGDLIDTQKGFAFKNTCSTLYIFMAWWPAYHLICSMLFDKFSNIHFLQDKC